MALTAFSDDNVQPSGVLDSLKDAANKTAENVKSGFNRAGEMLTGATENVRDSAQNTSKTVKDKADDAARAGREQFENVSSQAKGSGKDLRNKAENLKVNAATRRALNLNAIIDHHFSCPNFCLTVQQ